jgi:hypothetical protein
VRKAGAVGDQAFRVGNIGDARLNYVTSSEKHPLQPAVWIKQFLLRMGKFGISVRTVFKMLRGVLTLVAQNKLVSSGLEVK